MLFLLSDVKRKRSVHEQFNVIFWRNPKCRGFGLDSLCQIIGHFDFDQCATVIGWRQADAAVFVLGYFLMNERHAD